MKYIALCHTCRYQHTIEFDPAKGPPPSAFSDWYTKHPHPHVTEFRFPRRRQQDGHSKPKTGFKEYIHNADVKVAYGASASPTITLASLAASSSLLGGRESTAIDNGTDKYLDFLAGANYVAAGSNNQAGQIYTCVVAALDDTPTWPDVFDGTDSAETVTDAGVFNSICRVMHVIGADATASQNWPTTLMSVAAMFNGIVPDQFVYFVTHNIQTSTNAWNSTGNTFKHTPIYATVT